MKAIKFITLFLLLVTIYILSYFVYLRLYYSHENINRIESDLGRRYYHTGILNEDSFERLRPSKHAPVDYEESTNLYQENKKGNIIIFNYVNEDWVSYTVYRRDEFYEVYIPTSSVNLVVSEEIGRYKEGK